jgi:hypothetical protein
LGSREPCKMDIKLCAMRARKRKQVSTLVVDAFESPFKPYIYNSLRDYAF